MATTQPAKSSMIELVKDVLDVEGRVERNPYGMLAGALGAGFVLGGGIFTRLTGRFVSTALRLGLMAAWSRLEQELGWCLRRTAKTASPPHEKGESS